MSDQPTIRHATRQDVPTVFKIMKEAAIDQDALDAFKVTEESLLATLSFAPALSNGVGSTKASAHSSVTSPLIEFSPGYAKILLIVTPEGDVAGMAMYFYIYSSWLSKPSILLENLGIRAEYRRHGYARMLIAELARELRRIDGGRIEWDCYKDNHRAQKFYESLGAVKPDNIDIFRLGGDALIALAES
ncbi:uncharacterized protein LTHEOB_10223 [Neofusicoccum parvum]|uniref:Uncharacterized protein LTHEOB_10223 n=1 Tax=Neofusicoccum parvum TaxID=310453 RepID=A0ACB5S090_9PEZI|nr:uncharacterized protein LTHEOB_10223 [Neofusicoccum parvum]